jgi:hypothetical protein
MPRLQRYMLLMLGSLLSGLLVAHAASYTFTTLDAPGSSFTNVFGINKAGEIVGIDSIHGSFVLSKEGYTTIGVPGSNETQADGINRVYLDLW